MDRILRVDLSEGTIHWQEDLPEWKTYWGRAFTAALLTKEVNPTCEPLGPFNKLIFAPGPLAGSPVPCSGRLSVGAKSPLTGGIKESNAGGTLAHSMGRLGIKAIVVEGAAPQGKTKVLHIQADAVRLLDAPETAGLTTGKTVKRLRQDLGPCSFAVIGPAGEMGLLAAGIAVTDKEGRAARYAGRGGLGAVMGAKGLKAIAIDTSKAPRPKALDQEAFRERNRALIQLLKENPLTSKTYTEYGTAAALATVNAFGALPTKNFRQGRFQGAEKINGDTLHDLILARQGEGHISHACMPGCPIQCSNVFADDAGKEVVAPLEYETLGLVGSNLCIDSLDAIAAINARLNELGLDTIETGATLGLFMEAGLLPFGDAKGVLALLDQLEEGTITGRLVGSGALVAGRVLGLTRIPVVKGQAMPAYDPRGIKGTGVTYATTAMGADHTAGHTLRAKINHLDLKGQAAIARANQINMGGIDSLGLCMMVGPALAGDFTLLANLLQAYRGWEADAGFVAETGKAVLGMEREFNRRAGFSLAHDRLPEFVYNEPLSPHDAVFDVSEEDMEGVFSFLETDLKIDRE